MHIAVIGGGLMGRAIALDFALAGHDVTLRDVSADRLAAAQDGIARLGTQLVTQGVRAESAVVEAAGRIALAEDIGMAVAQVAYVVESVTEDLAIKLAVFTELDAAAPAPAIFASNTSGYRPDQLAAALQPGRRLVLTHYFNPAHLVPLVEVAVGPATDPATVDWVVELLRGAGKVPVRIKRTLNGLAGNRLQMALLREALHLVEEGVVEPADLDAIVTAGLGPRWAAIGPLAVCDLGGFPTWESLARSITPDLDNRVGAPPLLAERMARGELGVASGRGFFDWSAEDVEGTVARRDQMLIAAARINGHGDARPSQGRTEPSSRP